MSRNSLSLNFGFIFISTGLPQTNFIIFNLQMFNLFSYQPFDNFTTTIGTNIMILSDCQAYIKGLRSSVIRFTMVWECLGKFNDQGRKKTLSHVTEDMKKSDKSGEFTPLVGTKPFFGPKIRANLRNF